MKNRLWILAIVVGCVFVVGTFSAVAQSGKTPPKSVTLKAKMGDVTFPHEKHNKDMKIPCKQCHHMMDKEKDKMACRDCHKEAAEGKTLSVKDAFHKTCKGCHEQKVKEDASSKAPTQCKACHKK